MQINKINIKDKFELIPNFWEPKIAGELNGQHVKLAKLKGEFIWHQHELEDELFLVVKGELIMHFKEKTELIKEGEFIIVPKGTQHKPEAKEEVHVLLFEPCNTINTGEHTNNYTVISPETI